MGPKVRAGLVLSVVFLAGIGVGVGGTRFLSHRHAREMAKLSPEVRHGRAMVHMLSRRLDLSHEQREKVRAIVETHRADFERLREGEVERKKPVRERVRGEIREVLTDAQRQKFDEIVEEMESRSLHVR